MFLLGQVSEPGPQISILNIVELFIDLLLGMLGALYDLPELNELCF